CEAALAAAGAAPRAAPAGVAALTSAERRVAELADAGNEAREIAELLHVTPSEAAAYLASAKRKLAGSAA
ncbi:MAG TPA: hypothetical protein VGW10_06190, partial [Solirubrobacteraceae bacterium]|nr:hypothetical protein [Solirubrobacteraceae bacterium]